MGCVAKKRRSRVAKHSAGQRSDSILARSARRKLLDGIDPTQLELRALRRCENRAEKKLRWLYYETIPKGDWLAMSGRQSKTVNEQAIRYGLPIGDEEINLPEVVRALHDFFEQNKYRLAGEDSDEFGPVTPALERLREEKAAIARIQRLQMEKQLVDRIEMRTCLGQIAGRIRQFGEQLQQAYGADALEWLNDVLDDCQRTVMGTLGMERLEEQDPPE